MKFTPLNNKPNLSSGRFETTIPSMSNDSRGFPHICWLEKKNGHNEVNYSFWDGLQWAYNSIPMVFGSEEEILSSKNGLILDNDSPVLSFSRRISNGSSLNVFFSNGGEWIRNELNVNYDTKWIGIVKTAKGLVYSSSSSTSLDSSSSSSSFDSTSSSSFNESSSSSSLIYSSSTSSEIYSSSSSIEKSSSSSIDSSSSSSYHDSNIIVCTYDNEYIRVYSVTEYAWDLIGETSFVLDSIQGAKIASCGNKIGVIAKGTFGLVYNFFDVDGGIWSFADFKLLNASIFDGDIIDFDIVGYNSEEDGVISIAWLEDRVSSFYVRNINADSNGNEFVSGDTIVSSRTKTVKAGNYVSHGFRHVAISLNDGLPVIFAAGTETVLYSKALDNIWGNSIVDISGISDGIVPNGLSVKIYDNMAKIAFSNYGVYYFEQGDGGFDSSYPNLVVLNAEKIFLSTWESGLLSGTEMQCTYASRVGDILKESNKKTTIIISDKEDPDCYDSSSSSSKDSSSSSSIGYSSSSSSIDSSSSSSSIDSSSSSSDGYSSSSSSSSSS